MDIPPPPDGGYSRMRQIKTWFPPVTSTHGLGMREAQDGSTTKRSRQETDEEFYNDAASGRHRREYASAIRIILAYFNSKSTLQATQCIQEAAAEWCQPYFGSNKACWGRNGCGTFLAEHSHFLQPGVPGCCRLRRAHVGPPRSKSSPSAFPPYLEPTMISTGETLEILRRVAGEPACESGRFDGRSPWGPWTMGSPNTRVGAAALEQHSSLLAHIPEVVAQIAKADFEWLGPRDEEGQPLPHEALVARVAREKRLSRRWLDKSKGFTMGMVEAELDAWEAADAARLAGPKPKPRCRVSSTGSIVPEEGYTPKDLVRTPMVREDLPPPRPRTPGNSYRNDGAEEMAARNRKSMAEPPYAVLRARALFTTEIKEDGTYARRPRGRGRAKRTHIRPQTAEPPNMETLSLGVSLDDGTDPSTATTLAPGSGSANYSKTVTPLAAATTGTSPPDRGDAPGHEYDKWCLCEACDAVTWAWKR